MAKSIEEVAIGVLSGPFDSLDDVPMSDVSLVTRAGIWERHGAAAGPTVRTIDDLLFGGQHSTVGTLSSHRPTGVDALCAQVRAVQDRFPACPLEGFPSDFQKSYEQVPGVPSEAAYLVIVQFCPLRRRPVFFIPSSQLFGSAAAPLNFSRYP